MNFTDWSEEITKNLKQTQEQYWKSMAEQRAKSENSQTSEIPKMTEGLEQLWSFISPQMPKQADDIMKQVFGMGKNRDQLSDNVSVLKDVVDSLVESQLNSFGVPTKKAQEELLEQVEQLKFENKTLKEHILVLEKQVAKHAPPAEEKEFKATAKKFSKRAKVKKVSKSASTTKTTSKFNHETIAPSPKNPDDLTKIKGVGPVIRDKLLAAGFQTFDQLGALTTDQAEELENQLGLQGRLIRDNWVTQAAQLASTEHQ